MSNTITISELGDILEKNISLKNFLKKLTSFILSYKDNLEKCTKRWVFQVHRFENSEDLGTMVYNFRYIFKEKKIYDFINKEFYTLMEFLDKKDIDVLEDNLLRNNLVLIIKHLEKENIVASIKDRLFNDDLEEENLEDIDFIEDNLEKFLKALGKYLSKIENEYICFKDIKEIKNKNISYRIDQKVRCYNDSLFFNASGKENTDNLSGYIEDKDALDGESVVFDNDLGGWVDKTRSQENIDYKKLFNSIIETLNKNPRSIIDSIKLNS